MCGTNGLGTIPPHKFLLFRHCSLAWSQGQCRCPRRRRSTTPTPYANRTSLDTCTPPLAFSGAFQAPARIGIIGDPSLIEREGRGHRVATSSRPGLTYLPAPAALMAWTAVMHTVLTTSSTVQPRERSLTGLARPCSTGPMAMPPVDCCTAL